MAAGFVVACALRSRAAGAGPRAVLDAAEPRLLGCSFCSPFLPMPMTLTGWFAGLLALALLAGCATAPPVQEMSDARQAIAAAREAGAAQHAAQRLAEAESLLASAEQYLAWANASGYWSARRAAVSAKETALDALLMSRKAIEAEKAGAAEGARR